MSTRGNALRTYFRQWRAEEAKKEARRKRVREAVRRHRARRKAADPYYLEKAAAAAREARQKRRERMAELREMAPAAIERGEFPPGYLHWSGADPTKEQLADIWELHYRRGGKPFDEIQ